MKKKTQLTRAQMRMARTLGLSAATARIVARMSLAGDEQPGYSSATEAAQNERQMRKMGIRRDLDEEDLRRARKKQHIEQGGLDEDAADELTSCSDDELDAKCAGEDVDASDADEVDADGDADDDADDDDADDDDADDDDADADDSYDGATAEQKMRRLQDQTMGDSSDGEDAQRRRRAKHEAAGCTPAEAKRLSELDDEELSAEIEAAGIDILGVEDEDLRSAIDAQRRFGVLKLTARQERLLERAGLLQAYERVSSSGERLRCRGGICVKACKPACKCSACRKAKIS